MAVRKAPLFNLQSIKFTQDKNGIERPNFYVDVIEGPVTFEQPSQVFKRFETTPHDGENVPEERVRPGRSMRMNKMSDADWEALCVARGMGTHPACKPFDIIRGAMKMPRLLDEGVGFYHLITHLMRAPLGNVMENVKKVATHMLSFAHVGTYGGTNDPAVAQTLECFKVAEPFIAAWIEVKRVKAAQIRTASRARARITEVRDTREWANQRERLSKEKAAILQQYIDDIGSDEQNEHIEYIVDHCFNGRIRADLLDRLDELEEEENKLGLYDLEGEDEIEMSREEIKRFISKVSNFESALLACHVHIARNFYSSYSCAGATMFSLPGHRTFVLTNQMLSLAEEILSEAISSIIAVHVAGEDASAIAKYFNDTWVRLAEATPDECNIFVCAMRDYEIAIRRSEKDEAIKLAVGKPWGIREDILKPLRIVLNSVSVPTVARCTRVFKQVAFDPYTIINEQYRCLNLIKRPSDEFLESVRLATRFLCCKAYQYYWKQPVPDLYAHVFGRTEDEGIAEMANQGQFVGIKAYDGLDITGLAAAGYTELDMHVKDSTHVPMEPEVALNSQRYNSAPVSDRRELFHYMVNDPKREMDHARTELHKGGVVPVRLTVKPEQKEGGRMIHMECGGVRRWNSVIQDHHVAISRVYKGSLLGKSYVSKYEAIHEALNSARDAVKAGYKVFYVSTDFKKFGHTIPASISRIVAEEVGKFFGQEHFGMIFDLLKRQSLAFTYDGISGTMNNDNEADGQGMRNGVWQLLLLAILYSGFERLSEKLPELSKAFPIYPLFFQDDHVLVVAARPRPDVRAEEWEEDFKKRLLHELMYVYNTRGIQMEENKTKISTSGFSLLGDDYDANGLLANNVKGLVTMLRPPKSNCPTGADYINQVLEGVHSGTQAGIHVNTAYRAGVLAVSLLVATLDVRSTVPDPMQLAVRMFLPARFGGAGFPLPHHLVAGLENSRLPDFVSVLFKHIVSKSTYSDISALCYGHMVALCDKDPYDNSTDEAQLLRRNAVRRYLNTTSYGKVVLTMMEQNDLRVQQVNEKIASMSCVPPTLTQFLMDLHPFAESAIHAKAILESASLRALLSPSQITMACRNNMNSFLKWRRQKFSYKQCFIGNSVMAATRKILPTNMYTGVSVPVDLILLPVPVSQRLSHYTVDLHPQHPSESSEALVFGNPHPTICNFEPLPNVKDLQRYKNLNEASYAFASSRHNSDIIGHMEEIAEMSYDPHITKPVGDPVPFRDVSGLTLARNIVAPWMKTRGQNMTAVMPNVKNRKQSEHINYGLLKFLALYRKQESTTWMITKFAVWEDPDLVVSAIARNVKTPDNIQKTVEDLMKSKDIIDSGSINKDEIRSQVDEDIAYSLNFELRHAKEIRRLRKKEFRQVSNLSKFAKKVRKYKEPDVILKHLSSIADSAFTRNRAADLVRSMARRNPNKASKIVWETFVRAMLDRRIMNNVKVSRILARYPKRLLAYDIPKLRQDPDWTKVMASKKEIKVLTSLLKEAGIIWKFMNWLESIWASRRLGPFPLTGAPPAKRIKRFLFAMPDVWLHAMRKQVVFLLYHAPTSDEKEKMRLFCKGWANRYAHQARERGALLSIIRSSVPDLSKKGDLPEGVLSVYIGAKTYQLLTCVYNMMAEDIDATIADPEKAIEKGYQYWISRIRTKFGLELKTDLESTMASLISLGYNNKVYALYEALGEAYVRCKLILKDIGVRKSEKNFYKKFNYATYISRANWDSMLSTHGEFTEKEVQDMTEYLTADTITWAVPLLFKSKSEGKDYIKTEEDMIKDNLRRMLGLGALQTISTPHTSILTHIPLIPKEEDFIKPGRDDEYKKVMEDTIKAADNNKNIQHVESGKKEKEKEDDDDEDDDTILDIQVHTSDKDADTLKGHEVAEDEFDDFVVDLVDSQRTTSSQSSSTLTSIMSNMEEVATVQTGNETTASNELTMDDEAFWDDFDPDKGSEVVKEDNLDDLFDD